MDELKFVLRCFVFSCLLFAASQIKTNGVTIEAQLQSFLVSSPVAGFMNQAAQGGVKFVNEAYAVISKNVTGWVGGTHEKQLVRNPSAKKTSNNSDFKTDEADVTIDDIDLE